MIKKFFMGMAICCINSYYAHTPLFLTDKAMVKLAEKIIARSKKGDTAVQQRIIDGITEYNYGSEAEGYRIQIDSQKNTVSIGIGSRVNEAPILILRTKTQVQSHGKITEKGGTVTIKHFDNTTVTKLWRNKRGEERVWNTVTLSAKNYQKCVQECNDETAALIHALLEKKKSTTTEKSDNKMQETNDSEELAIASTHDCDWTKLQIVAQLDISPLQGERNIISFLQ